MMRLTYRVLKTSTSQYRTQLMPERTFSFFRMKIRSEEETNFSLIRSAIRSSARNMEYVKSNPRRRFSVSKSRNLVKHVEDAVEADGNDDVEKPIGKAMKNSVLKIEKRVLTGSFKNSPLKEENLDLFMEISQGDNAVLKELRFLQMKYDMMVALYGVKPKMNKQKWEEFLSYGTTMRKSYLKYLFANALRSENKEKPKYDLPDSNFTEDGSMTFSDPMCHHLFHNSMFLKFRIGSIRKQRYSKLMASMLYSPEIYIDCSYDKYMNLMESKYMAKQIVQCMSDNLNSDQPYHIVLCNFDKDSAFAKALTKYSGLFYEDNYPITLTSKSYLDLCPKEKLVYLSPHASQILKTNDPDKKYIIGGYVDKVNSRPISLAKAKEDNIAMAKFPLDRYLEWRQGKKSLCINHVFSIMMTLKNDNNDWVKAFEVLPKRCTMATGNKKKKKSSVRQNTDYVFSVVSPGEDLQIEFDDVNVDYKGN